MSIYSITVQAELHPKQGVTESATFGITQDRPYPTLDRRIEWANDGRVLFSSYGADPKGLDIARLLKHRARKGTLKGFPGAKALPRPGDCLEVECDILVPAALENQITRENMKKIRTRILAEAANGPTTTEAEEYLQRRGVLILPDLFLNSGGVTVSYFEWGKNLTHMRYGRLEKRMDEVYRHHLVAATEELAGERFPAASRRVLLRGADEEDLVNSGLEETMIAAYNEIRETSRRYRSVDQLRTAAYILAIEKVGQSYLELGIFP